MTSRTEVKLAAMKPGQHVTFPTDGQGNHTGTLVRFDARGPLAGEDARVAVYRNSEGEEVRVCTSLGYTGWINTPAQTRSSAKDGTATEYEIEMDDGRGDWRTSGYGVVHRAGCRDLRDPERVGTDWRQGVAALGTDWELDVEENLVRLAPCAR